MKKAKAKAEAEAAKTLTHILDVLLSSHFLLLSSRGWLQLLLTSKTCWRNDRLDSALYVNVYIKMKRLQKTPHYSYDYMWNLRDSDCCHTGYGWLVHNCYKSSLFGRFIVAIKQSPVVHFEPSQHTAQTPVYTIVDDDKPIYINVGRLVNVNGNLVNVKGNLVNVETVDGGARKLYERKKIFCLRYPTNTNEPPPKTIQAREALRTHPHFDWFYTRACEVCGQWLAVKHRGGLHDSFEQVCHKLRQAGADVDCEEQEHRKTCVGPRAKVNHLIMS